MLSTAQVLEAVASAQCLGGRYLSQGETLLVFEVPDLRAGLRTAARAGSRGARPEAAVSGLGGPVL